MRIFFLILISVVIIGIFAINSIQTAYGLNCPDGKTIESIRAHAEKIRLLLPPPGIPSIIGDDGYCSIFGFKDNDNDLHELYMKIGGTQVVVIHGVMHDEWWKMGTFSGPLGYPTVDEIFFSRRTNEGLIDSSRSAQFFDNGAIYSSSHGVYAMYGEIFKKYQKIYQKLGFPTSEETESPYITGGKFINFEYGVICSKPNGEIVWAQDKIGPDACNELFNSGTPTKSITIDLGWIVAAVFVSAVFVSAVAFIIILKIKRRPPSIPYGIHEIDEQGEFVGIVRNFETDSHDKLNCSMILQRYKKNSRKLVEPILVKLHFYDEGDKEISDNDVVQINGRWKTKNEFTAYRLYNHSKKAEIFLNY